MSRGLLTNAIAGAIGDLEAVGEGLAGAEINKVGLIGQRLGLNIGIGAISLLAVDEGTGLDGVRGQDSGITTPLVVVVVVVIVAVVAVVAVVIIVVIVSLVVVVIVVVVVVSLVSVLCSGQRKQRDRHEKSCEPDHPV